MHPLDDSAKYTTLDVANMRGSVSALPLQCRQAWGESRLVSVPKLAKKIHQIVVTGMGGSALGADVLRHLFSDQLPVPVVIVNGYDLPASVDQHTLVVASSYSGTTEETLSAYRQARERKAFLIGITTGGALGEWCDRDGIPYYKIVATHNPCGQPRMALGYAVVGLIGLLVTAGLLEVSDTEMQAAIAYLDDIDEAFRTETPTSRNIAKQIAERMRGTMPLIIASEHLVGNAHVIANQCNENAKNFAVSFTIPELNHHLLEGLALPQTGTAHLSALLIDSLLYRPENQLRFAVTKTVLDRQKISWQEVRLTGKTKLAQSLELLALGSAVAFFLAIINEVNPSPIPWVDFFKNELTQQKNHAGK